MSNPSQSKGGPVANCTAPTVTPCFSEPPPLAEVTKLLPGGYSGDCQGTQPKSGVVVEMLGWWWEWRYRMGLLDKMLDKTFKRKKRADDLTRKPLFL
jgi:hypothetical protein